MRDFPLLFSSMCPQDANLRCFCLAVAFIFPVCIQLLSRSLYSSCRDYLTAHMVVPKLLEYGILSKLIFVTLPVSISQHFSSCCVINCIVPAVEKFSVRASR